MVALIFMLAVSVDTAAAKNAKLKSVNAALRMALNSLRSFQHSKEANQESAIGDFVTGSDVEDFSICGISDYKAHIDGQFVYVCPHDYVMVGWLYAPNSIEDVPGYSLCCPENDWEKKPDQQKPGVEGGRHYIQGTGVENFNECGFSNYQAEIDGYFFYVCPHDYVAVGWMHATASWGKPVCCPKSSWEKYSDHEKAIGDYIQGTGVENFDECGISHYLARIDGESANVCPYDHVTVGYMPDGGLGHTLCCKKNSWEYKDRSAECLDTAGSAMDRHGNSCASYENPGVCGDYDNDGFNANIMCCVCGGGSIPRI